MGHLPWHLGQFRTSCWLSLFVNEMDDFCNAWLTVGEPDADNYVFNSQKSTQLNRVTIFPPASRVPLF